jgi:hypothetical protein
MYGPVIGVVSLLESLDVEAVASSLWSIAGAIAAIQPQAGGQFGIILAAGHDASRRGGSTSPESARDLLSAARQSRQAKTQFRICVGISSIQNWHGQVCFSRVPHIAIEAFRNVPDVQAIGRAFRDRDKLELVRDVHDLPIAGTAALEYFVVKLQSFRSIFKDTFDDRDGACGADFVAALSATKISGLALPTTQRELAAFVKKCDEIVQGAWSEDQIRRRLWFLGISASEWLTAPA